MIFLSLYIPRYTHEYKKREIIEQTAGKLLHTVDFVLRDQPALEKGRYTVETDRYSLQFDEQIGAKTPLIVGNWYQAKGTYVSSDDDWLKPTGSYKIRLTVQSITDITQSGLSVKYTDEKITSFLLRQRDKVLHRTMQTFHPDEAGLLLGITLGRRPSRESTLYKHIKQIGLLHILVASGANIAIIGGVFHASIKYFTPKKMSIILTLFWVFLYICLVGAEPSIIRAGLLFAATTFSVLLGRQRTSLLSLIFVGLFMLIYQPFLIYSLSFLLSFAATVGVILAESSTENVENSGVWASISHVLKDNFNIAISTTLFTAPVILMTFNEFELFSIVANVFLLWMVEILFIWGMVYMVSCMLLYPILSYTIGSILWVPLAIFVRLINLFSTWPSVVISVLHPSYHIVIFYYVSLCASLYVKLARRKTER